MKKQNRLSVTLMSSLIWTYHTSSGVHRKSVGQCWKQKGRRHAERSSWEGKKSERHGRIGSIKPQEGTFL